MTDYNQQPTTATAEATRLIATNPRFTIVEESGYAVEIIGAKPVKNAGGNSQKE